MHQALLIDEIVQIVFDLCLDFGDGSTLSRAARTCKAWRDPALDRLWHRLTDVTPLLQLIPGLIQVNGVYVFESPVLPDLCALRSYAMRVKHVNNRQNVQLHSTVSSILLSATSNGFLQRLDLDLGFKPNTLKNTNIAASNLLANVPSLTTLHLRGSASERLLRTVSAISNLRTLSLRISTSLDLETIVAISSFPFLEELDLHAIHVRPTELAEKWAVRGSAAPCFPSLKSLTVRARTALIGTVLNAMQSDQLRVLYIDVEPVAQSDDAWSTLFNIMKDKTPFLHDFTIDHHVDTDLVVLEDSNANDSNNAPIATTDATIDLEDMLRFDLMQPLFKLHELRRVIFDTTPPITVRDGDFVHLATQWPRLTYLDLGSVPTVDPRWAPQTSLQGLVTISQKFTNLTNLMIPIDTAKSVADIPKHPQATNILRKLTVTSLVAPDTTLMVKTLHALFPHLQEIDGTSDHEEQWTDIQSAFRSLRDTSPGS
ncbi:hypothetical protein VNI00_000791 [Paramarasmius palmivorus]|uniref:F-box domain-containing protein n=1 Tax=Paramarasmius palmivorus TaxID=297713 RepID=A0AAW0E607_9AGAR